MRKEIQMDKNFRGDSDENVVDFETVDDLPEAAQREIRGQLYKLRRMSELRQSDSLENRLVLAANVAMKSQNTYGECQEGVLSIIRNAAKDWFVRTMRPLQTYEEVKQNQVVATQKGEDRDVIDLMPDANGVWRMAED